MIAKEKSSINFKLSESSNDYRVKMSVRIFMKLVKYLLGYSL